MYLTGDSTDCDAIFCCIVPYIISPNCKLSSEQALQELCEGSYEQQKTCSNQAYRSKPVFPLAPGIYQVTHAFVNL